MAEMADWVEMAEILGEGQYILMHGGVPWGLTAREGSL